MTSLIDLDEFLYVVDQNKLMGKGIGFVDLHLLASACLAENPLWTSKPLRFLFIPASFGMTGKKSTLLFGGFYKQKLGVTIGAFFSHRLVPYGKSAVGKVAAAVEYFTPFGLALYKSTAAVFLRTSDAGCLPAVA